ncbi:energy transducer TonB [Hymenobacter glacieicola]|uniref:Cell envelope biogenesis protein TonB n=1 Tax=Hymenobacter glacieicola TaxID=1562124 RepID=A0ABQ1WXN6_9BACT|nr:energy transducer TonB [Hymenobacter glacieicola]GGG46422.1 cell envelope biogenesis protein TonB [Hymenobacter glacieicola]
MTTAPHTSLLSLDDIVFEGRNKAYGAYVLRKAYGRHVTTAIVIATALAALLIAIPLLVQRLWPAVTEGPVDVSKGPIIDILPPPTILQKITPPPAGGAVTVRPPAPATPTRVVRDELVKTPPVDVEVQAIDGPAISGPIAAEGDGTTTIPGGGVGGSDTVTKPAAAAITEPFVHVENMPEFMGGEAALAKYFQRHLRYPPQALRAGVEGKVYISFTVNSDGTITDVSVLKGLGYGTDEEASRVIRQMPAWKPGYQNHRAVPVRYNLPITFKYE